MLTFKRVTDFILEGVIFIGSIAVNLLTIICTRLLHFIIAFAHVGECLAIAIRIDNRLSSKAAEGSIWNHIHCNVRHANMCSVRVSLGERLGPLSRGPLDELWLEQSTSLVTEISTRGIRVWWE